MKLFFSALLCSLQFVSVAFGADKPATPEPQVKSLEVDTSSFGNRGRQHASLVAELSLLQFPLPAAVGLKLAGHLTQQLQVELGVQRASLSLENKLTLYTLHYSLDVRHFFGNSFYVMGGIGYRQMGLTIETEEVTGSPALQLGLLLNSPGLDLAIGNRWSWENFVLGVDWVGLFVAKKVETTPINAKASGLEQLEQLRKKAGDAINTVANLPTVYILRLHIGAAN